MRAHDGIGNQYGESQSAPREVGRPADVAAAAERAGSDVDDGDGRRLVPDSVIVTSTVVAVVCARQTASMIATSPARRRASSTLAWMSTSAMTSSCTGGFSGGWAICVAWTMMERSERGRSSSFCCPWMKRAYSFISSSTATSLSMARSASDTVFRVRSFSVRSDNSSRV